jgi:hypothetical protein
VRYGSFTEEAKGFRGASCSRRSNDTRWWLNSGTPLNPTWARRSRGYAQIDARASTEAGKFRTPFPPSTFHWSDRNTLTLRRAFQISLWLCAVTNVPLASIAAGPLTVTLPTECVVQPRGPCPRRIRRSCTMAPSFESGANGGVSITMQPTTPSPSSRSPGAARRTGPSGPGSCCLMNPSIGFTAPRPPGWSAAPDGGMSHDIPSRTHRRHGALCERRHTRT